jgi:hypothetical protein
MWEGFNSLNERASVSKANWNVSIIFHRAHVSGKRVPFLDTGQYPTTFKGSSTSRSAYLQTWLNTIMEREVLILS